MKTVLKNVLGLLILSSSAFCQTKDVTPHQTINPCLQTISYAVDDILLKQSLGQNLSKVDKNPVFTGGLEELKKYFVENPLTDPKAKDLVFRVHIGFLVNCHGKFCELKIISKGKGELENLAQQVLTIVKNMPQNWQSAFVEKKPVDCYQILSFTVIGGQLDKVSYR
ncbi:hypothetical protein AD998_20295 [bacterium 336/3]|nr:hypothetical protein AD998_20295 [bacterium 336/3]